MKLQNIQQHIHKFTATTGGDPTTLNISMADAAQILSELVGTGYIPADNRDQAIEAMNAGGQDIITFFESTEIYGLKVKVFPVVS